METTSGELQLWEAYGVQRSFLYFEMVLAPTYDTCTLFVYGENKPSLLHNTFSLMDHDWSMGQFFSSASLQTWTKPKNYNVLEAWEKEQLINESNIGESEAQLRNVSAILF